MVMLGIIEAYIGTKPVDVANFLEIPVWCYDTDGEAWIIMESMIVMCITLWNRWGWELWAWWATAWRRLACSWSWRVACSWSWLGSNSTINFGYRRQDTHTREIPPWSPHEILPCSDDYDPFPDDYEYVSDDEGDQAFSHDYSHNLGFLAMDEWVE